MAQNITRIISELTQNSIDAGCKSLEIVIKISGDVYEIIVIDDGEISGDINKFCDKGVSYKESSGLGLYNINEFCLKNDGALTITRYDKTIVRVEFQKDSFDNMCGLDEVLYLLSINDISLNFKFQKNDYIFVYDSKKIKDILNGVSIKELEVMNFLKEYIHDGLNQK